MRVLNLLKVLHERTRSETQAHSNIGLAKRMFCRAYEINRIGAHYDQYSRNDISTEFILMAYLSRKVFINEKVLRGRYYYDEIIENENEFTLGLWKIYSKEVFNEVLPELPVPTTYNELETIFMSSTARMFSLYDTVKSAVIHSTIHDSPHCKSMIEFDLFACLPCAISWTSTQNGASKTDGRTEAPQRLLQACMAFYRYDHMKASEPYVGFWKENATAALTKAVSLWQDKYITKFRNGTMYDMMPLPDKFTPVEKFNWNIKRT